MTAQIFNTMVLLAVVVSVVSAIVCFFKQQFLYGTLSMGVGLGAFLGGVVVSALVSGDYSSAAGAGGTLLVVCGGMVLIAKRIQSQEVAKVPPIEG